MALPPGIVYLGLHLHHFILPPACVYVFDRLARDVLNIHTSRWAFILGSLLAFPIAFTFNVLYKSYVNQRAAAACGAVLPPQLPVKYIGGLDILRANLLQDKSGYIGKEVVLILGV
jgi:hypothetical protein